MRIHTIMTRAITICAVALAVAAACVPPRATAQSDAARIADYPLVGDEGQDLPNHKVKAARTDRPASRRRGGRQSRPGAIFFK